LLLHLVEGQGWSNAHKNKQTDKGNSFLPSPVFFALALVSLWQNLKGSQLAKKGGWQRTSHSIKILHMEDELIADNSLITNTIMF